MTCLERRWVGARAMGLALLDAGARDRARQRPLSGGPLGRSGSRCRACVHPRMAQTLADLPYEPFPDVGNAIPELASIVATLPSRLPISGAPQTSGTPAFAGQVTGIVGCEGRDLNPYANYGASTSS